ncbi:hypothetical protein UPYG_G00030310 [Umbra pygmaea]|uniref:C2H2-type domain-containing protein n=1 Tax=Umbra pygmaea TaxID=75934 RepID=A0ABD0Y9P1_UMBPY
MADIKPNKQENKERDGVKPVCDSSGATLEPLQRHTSSLKNNAAGLSEQLSSDEPPNLLNGAQPSPFVPSSVPAVLHTSQAAHSLPSGALVNGPGSHPASEESCGLNKNSTMPNNVLVEAQDGQLRQAGGDPSPQVLSPPSELQSDTLKKPAGLGPILKTHASLQLGANNTPPSDSEESEVESTYRAPTHTLSCHSPQSCQMPINQIWTAEGVKAGGRFIWDLNTTESSESSSDGYDVSDALRWDSQKDLIHVLWNNHTVDKSVEASAARVMHQFSHQRPRKRQIHLVGTAEPTERVYNGGSNLTYKKWYIEEVEDEEEEDFLSNTNKDNCKKMDSFKEHPSISPVIIKKLIVRADCHEDNSSHSLFSRKPKQLQTEQCEEPSFFPCTKCNVNFKEKRHLHRHMMYHLNGHNHEVHLSENSPRPFICRECGRSFRDRNSLLKHMIIHQERREKLIEEIQGLNKLQDKGRNAKLQCPQCVFGTDCPKTFIQHAKTHEKDKCYYCCEVCNHMALTERELDAHLLCHKSKSNKKNMIKDEELKSPTHNNEQSPVWFQCNVGPFRTQNTNGHKRHFELKCQQSGHKDECESTPFHNAPDHEDQNTLGDSSQKAADIHLLQLKSKFCVQKPAIWTRADMPFGSCGVADFYVRDTADTQKKSRNISSLPFNCSFVSPTNTLSPSVWRIDKPNKLSKPTEKIDVTTGLPYVEEDSQLYDHVVSGMPERTKYPSDVDVLLSSSTVKPSQVLHQSSVSDKIQGGLIGRKSEAQAVIQKSPSKRKMSTPFRNNVDNMVDYVLAKPNQKSTTPEDSEESGGDDEDTYDFSAYTSEATANFLDTVENQENPYARSYFIRRQRSSSAKHNPETAGDVGQIDSNGCQLDRQFEKPDETEGEYDSDDIQQLIIKEECIESSVCDESPDSQTPTDIHAQSLSYDVCPSFGMERKSCPYCPAVFESGVGLSNHVRGHLHRLGLSYDARHAVSPEQVASHDRQPRIRRKISSIARRIRKAEKPASQTEHTCPLCCGWFDTKTGLSNHVRGHLKRIGKTITGSSKSPVCILTELLKDEQEHQKILQILKGKQFFSRPIISQKFIGSDGLFQTPTGMPVKIQHGCQPGQDDNPISWGNSATVSMLEEVEQDKPFPQSKSIMIQGVNVPAQSTLVDFQRPKTADIEQLMNNNRSCDADRTHITVTKEMLQDGQGQEYNNLEPHWVHERNESNKKICVHCNATFPSAVSLSNHLRAYARRKRVAMLEGTTYSCIQKKPRLRAGPKKKLFSDFPRTVDKIYRLTCRFCDLVFQGPLSIQEDWIKHLQRHLMHTSVPHTGAGLVEIVVPQEETEPRGCLEQATSDEHYMSQHPQTHHDNMCLEHLSPNNHHLPQPEAPLPYGRTKPSEHPEPQEPQLPHAHPSSNKHPRLKQHTAPLDLLPVAS